MSESRFITSPVKDKPWTWGITEIYEEIADELGFELRTQPDGSLPNGFNGQFTHEELLHILGELRDSGVTEKDQERTKQELMQDIAGLVGIDDGYRTFALFKHEALYEILVAVKGWETHATGGD
jgi:hypothetical protein